MTDQKPNDTDHSTPDESYTWTGSDAPHGESAGAGSDSTSGSAGASASGSAGSAGTSAGTTATAILESIRVAVDDLADRASPTVREFGARAAEFTADAADKAAPYVRKAGDATAEASSKLASKSRSWAAEVRAAMASQDADAPGRHGHLALDTRRRCRLVGDEGAGVPRRRLRLVRRPDSRLTSKPILRP